MKASTTKLSTEYFIWANPAAQAALGTDFTDQGPTVSPCFLMNVLFDKCGWAGPGYHQLSNQVMERFSVVHTINRLQINGIMDDSSYLIQTDAELLFLMTTAQFSLAQDSGGIHP